MPRWNGLRPGARARRVTRAYVPGAPPDRRDRAAAARRALARRQRAAVRARVAAFVARQPDRALERPLGPLDAR